MLFICPQGKYPYLPSNIRLGPQTSVFHPEFNFRYLRSDLIENMSKYNEGWCIQSYFNQINTFQNIGISIQMSTYWVDFANTF
jgi:hypothetical protein